MSLIFLDGFDDGLYATRWLRNNYGVPTASVQNRNGLAIRGSRFTDRYMRRNLVAADEHATLTIGFWFYAPAFPLAQQLDESRHWVQFRGDGGVTNHVTMTVEPSGALRVTNGNGTILGTTDIVFQIGSSHYIECQATLHDTTGAVTIWVDGVQALALTNVDTRNGGTDAVFDAIQINGNASDSEELDDLYITNGAGAAPYSGALGDIVVDTLFPNGDGNYSDFVGSDGDSINNSLLVDENPHDGDTTYVESGTDTDRDSYGFDDLVYASGIVLGVIATAIVRNTGAADNLQISTRIAATDYDGGSIAAPAGYDGAVREIWQLSPASAGNWTIAEVNAAEFGIENVA